MDNKVRRHDLDWLRVIVFGLLIFYHVGMFFVPWGFHIKNNEVSEAFILPMLFLNQWRLPLLFLISGMGTRFALSHRSVGQFLRERNLRLLIPLVFGMLFIIPPQVYLERLTQGLDYVSFFHFYPHYFDGIYPTGNFSWHHLWFLPYLLTFSIVLAPLFVHLRDYPFSRLMGIIRQGVKHPISLYIFAIPLILVEIYMKPYFPLTRDLISDWYGFTHYLLFFFYGYVFISVREEFWNTIQKTGQMTLWIGILTFVLFLYCDRSGLSVEIVALTKIINAWTWIIAILAVGQKYLNHNSKLLSYCNEAVYPFYILHQTVMMVFAYQIRNVEIGIALKFGLMSGFTFVVTWIIYEMVKRLAVTRLLFGLKEKKP